MCKFSHFENKKFMAMYATQWITLYKFIKQIYNILNRAI